MLSPIALRMPSHLFWDIISFAEKYPRVFADKVGRLKNYTVKLYVDESVRPIAERRRPVPYHLREKRNKELDKMEADDLIEEHHGPVPWISNNVLAPKNDGGTRVTTDMRNVNKAIRPTNIPIPRVEEIKSELAGSKVFSKLNFQACLSPDWARHRIPLPDNVPW